MSWDWAEPGDERRVEKMDAAAAVGNADISTGEHTQAEFDAAYGDGVVEVSSALVPVQE